MVLNNLKKSRPATKLMWFLGYVFFTLSVLSYGVNQFVPDLFSGLDQIIHRTRFEVLTHIYHVNFIFNILYVIYILSNMSFMYAYVFILCLMPNLIYFVYSIIAFSIFTGHALYNLNKERFVINLLCLIVFLILSAAHRSANKKVTES